MWIVLIIVVVIAAYCVFVKIGNRMIDNIGMTNEKDKENMWWTIGMLADKNNKNNKNKEK